MAKDRARDPRRVPSLGISDPISHVKVTSIPESIEGPDSYRRSKERARYSIVKGQKLKLNAYGRTDSEERQEHRADVREHPGEQKMNRELGDVPTINIKS